MKQVNKEGPALLKDLPVVQEVSSAEQVKQLLETAQIIDTRPASQFAKDHVKGTINIPFNKSFPNWAGWIVDYHRPVYLMTDPQQLEDILKALRSVGIDNVPGYIDYAKVAATGELALETYGEVTPREIAKAVENSEVHVLDVRNLSERKEGHIPNSQHIMLGTLPKRLDEIAKGKPIVVQCRSGARSAIGVSILKANGFNEVLNLRGGIDLWQKEGFAVV